MIFIECQQGKPEWFEARSGAITASMVSEVRKRLKSGKNAGDFTTAAHNYAFRLAVERIKGGPIDEDQYETYSMRRGNELEHEARLLHEKKCNIFVEQSGLVLTDDKMFGYSTDGYIGDDGCAEYKCFLDGSKVRDILFNDASDEVIDQVQSGLWITNRNWCDFALYYPDLKSVGLELIINRIYRDDDYIEGMIEDLMLFNDEVERYMNKIDDLAEKHKKGFSVDIPPLLDNNLEGLF